MADDGSRLTRRQYVTTTGATLAGLTGVSATTAAQQGQPLEVLHGWTGGDGQTAIDNTTALFEEEHPDVPTDFKPIGGGGNRNLDTVVANRLANRNPPSTFANWPGKNLLKYEGVLGSVTELWNQEGFVDSHVEEAVELHQQNGEFRAVPIGSHRLNCLFYNVSIVEEAGVDPESLDSVDALIEAMETVQSETDAVPMTHGMQGVWTTLQLFGVVLLSQSGYETYMDVFSGNPGDGARSAVRSAFQSMETMLTNHITQDAASIGLTESNQNVVNGNAAFVHQGNWAAGAYRNAENFEYDQDWGFVPFPGTENLYTLHFDSFLYPANNPSPEHTRTWLRFVGGEAAQITFNQYKGSIPTRTDVSASEFGPYLQETMEDFANAEHRPPTLAHGLAVESETMSELSDVLSGEFTGPYDVQAATDGFMNVLSN